MKTKITLTIFALFLAINVAAQPPRIREEARRMTNRIDRQVGLSRGQYDEIYRINLRFASREIGPERRDRAYQRVMNERQWRDYYYGRRRPGPDARPRGPRNGPRDRGPYRNDYRRDRRR